LGTVSTPMSLMEAPLRFKAGYVQEH
jgi:hypothetical protein